MKDYRNPKKIYGTKCVEANGEGISSKKTNDIYMKINIAIIRGAIRLFTFI